MQLIPLYSKSKLFVFLAASVFTLAAVGTKAQRPLDVVLQCVNSVDLCSSDSTFILTCSVGNLSASDSVLLYDITLSFPTDKLTYRQVLFSNTLSEGLENKDYNAKVNGEIRVYGFNVFKPIVGSKALFAVQFKMHAGCEDSTTIDFSTLPTFNQEAKVYVNALDRTTVPIHIEDLTSRSLNFKFSNDTIVFTKFGQSLTLECTASTNAKANLEYADIELHFDTQKFRLQKLEAVNTTDSVSLDTTHQKWFVHVQRFDGGALSTQFGFRVFLQLQDTTNSKPGLFSATLLGKNVCACITRDTADSVVVITNVQPNTGIGISDADFQLKSDGDVWELRNMTDDPVDVKIYSVLARLAYQSLVQAQSTMVIDRSKLPRGLCAIQYQTQQDQFKKQLKFN